MKNKLKEAAEKADYEGYSKWIYFNGPVPSQHLEK